MALDLEFAQELLERGEAQAIANSVEGLQNQRDDYDKIDDTYVESFNEARGGIIDAGEIYSKGLDSRKDKHYFLFLDPNFPPEIAKATVDDPAWTTVGTVLKSPSLHTIQSAIDFTPAGSPAQGSTFTITINGTPFVHTVPAGGQTATQVVSALVSLINGGAEPVTATNNTTYLTVTPDVPGTAFTYSSSATGDSGVPLFIPNTLINSVQIQTTFGTGDLVGLEMLVITGVFGGSVYTITGNDGDGVTIGGNFVEVGDLVSITSSDIRADNTYDSTAHSAGNNTAISSFTTKATLQDVPETKKWDDRWNSFRFLRYNERVGTKDRIDGFDTVLGYMETFRDSLAVRDEYYDELTS